MPKCLIIDSIHESIFEILKRSNIEIDYKPDITRSEIIDRIEQYQIIIVRSKTPIDQEIIDKGKNLKVIARAGSGLDILDTERIRSKGISIINSPEANRDAVGDHTVGMLLSMFKKIHTADFEVRRGKWDRENNRGYELGNKIIAIIGYGNIGKAFATRLTGFGCEVIAYDKYHRNFGNKNCREVTMDEVFKEADVVSLHIPLTDETRGLVDEPYIDRFEKNFYLINTSRGEIVPMKSAVYGLKSGKLLGVGLDVLECEKLTKLNKEQRRFFTYLADSKKTLLTPHVGGWSYESYEKISRVLGEKIVMNFS